MKRLLVLLAIMLPLAFGQPSMSLADALSMAPEDATILIVSELGEIVGYSENLSRHDFALVMDTQFSGSATLMLTLPSGEPLTFEVDIVDGLASTEGVTLSEALAIAGVEELKIVAGNALPNEADEAQDLPDDRDLPEQAGSDSAGQDQAGGRPRPPATAGGNAAPGAERSSNRPTEAAGNSDGSASDGAGNAGGRASDGAGNAGGADTNQPEDAADAAGGASGNTGSGGGAPSDPDTGPGNAGGNPGNPGIPGNRQGNAGNNQGSAGGNPGRGGSAAEEHAPVTPGAP